MKKVTFIVITLFVFFFFGPAVGTSQAGTKDVQEDNCERRIVAYSATDVSTPGRIEIPTDYLPDEGEILVIETVSVVALVAIDHPIPIPCSIVAGGLMGVPLAMWSLTAGYVEPELRFHT